MLDDAINGLKATRGKTVLQYIGLKRNEENLGHVDLHKAEHSN